MQRLFAWTLASALCGASSWAGDETQAARDLLAWAEGPVRWYLLPSEWREIKQIEEPAAAVNFIDSFWRLRDPRPETPENELRDEFTSRVESADLLYGEKNVRGSLTDRGRALILLGPPPRMQLTSEEALAWKPGRRSRQRATTREIRVEIWRYEERDLPTKLVRVLRAAELDPAIELKFRLGRRGAQLVEGENSLIMLSRLALVRE